MQLLLNVLKKKKNKNKEPQLPRLKIDKSIGLTFLNVKILIFFKKGIFYNKNILSLCQRPSLEIKR